MQKFSSLLLGIVLICTNYALAQNDSIAPIATEPLKRGIYMSHAEFVSNNPSVLDSFYTDDKMRKKGLWEGTYNRIPRYAKNGRKAKRIWGFSDGKKAYIYHEKEYFPITIDGHKMSYFGYAFTDPSDAEMAKLMVVGYLGGAIGTMLYYQINDDLYTRRESKRAHKRFFIDQFTGTIIPDHLLMKSGYDFFNPKCRFYVYRYDKNLVNTDTINFVLNGSDTITLGPNDIYESKLMLSHTPYTICTKDSNSCLEFLNKTYEGAFISVSYDAISNGWKLESVDYNTGAWFLQKTDRKQGRTK